MVLTNLKRRLQTARRGHKLLKDKRDELWKVPGGCKGKPQGTWNSRKMLMDVHSRFVMARALMSDTHLEEASSTQNRRLLWKPHQRMWWVLKYGVWVFNRGTGRRGYFPYGFANTSGELDGAIIALSEVTPHLLRLAELENLHSSWQTKLKDPPQG